MRYQQNPGFVTKHWEQLWRSNIPDLLSFQKSLQNSNCSPGFVAIDAEPWGNPSSLVAEIGLCLILPFTPSQFPQPPNTLRRLCSPLRVSTRSIKVSGRDQGTGSEAFQAEHSQTIPSTEVESALVEILNTFRATLATVQGQQNDQAVPLILIGFDTFFEFQSMSTSFPLITDHFCSWVDLQELVKDAAKAKTTPSMRDSLIAFGNDQTTIGSIHEKHSAALDALRMATLLVNLLRHDAKEPLCLRFTPPQNCTNGKVLAGCRGTGQFSTKKLNVPKPGETLPFQAIAILRRTPLPMAPIAESQVFKAFAKYNPISFFCHTSKRYEFKAYIGFSSLDEVRWFVKDVRGTKSIFGGVWRVMSLCRPQLAAMQTTADLEGFKNLSLQETGRERGA